MNILLHPSYFPNIATFSALAQHDVCWEMADNYQKQTYRNRCYICNDRGKHILSIPIKHVGGMQGRQKYKDVLIENDYAWQRQHWRTLQTAYRTSPFFEFYEDELAPLFEKEQKFLLDFNLKTIAVICSCLQIPLPQAKTNVYDTAPNELLDARFLIQRKQNLESTFDHYTQVFGERHGFIKNVSTLDLLFNEGTNALTYLKNQNTDFLNV
ncbi:WbqC family protein [Aggregatimonas sangjinii]|uniref:WbqC family protein n=1 Tax=Aggregatimonas sangjinii TaxID=2583587 RepID=A0A5B7SYL5_9FLAO|nr:WbqC family protein [Aggregatimonas sangjinii]